MKTQANQKQSLDWKHSRTNKNTVEAKPKMEKKYQKTKNTAWGPKKKTQKDFLD